MIDESERRTNKMTQRMNWREQRRRKTSKVGQKVRLRGKVTRKMRSRIFKKARRKDDTRISKHVWKRKKN